MHKEIDPDSRDSNREIVEILILRIREYIQDHFPQLDHRQPAIVESCIYTVCVLKQLIMYHWCNLID